MIKKTLILFLILVLLCGNAFAQADRIALDIGLHTETETKHLTADLVSVDGKAYLLSDLFPSYAISFPFSSDPELYGIRSAVISLTQLLRQDFSALQSDWFSAQTLSSEKGFYTGDLFDSATQMQTFTISLADILSSSGETDLTDLFHSFGSALDLSSVSLIVRVYDSGKYVSFSALTKDLTICTVSCDFSVYGKKKIVWGYPDNGRNYYWVLEAAVLTEADTELSCALYVDRLKSGFRDASGSTPVLSEKWSIHQVSESQLQIDAEIIPANKLDTFQVSCLIDDEISARIQFTNAEQNCLSLTTKESPEEKNLDGYQLISIEDLSTPSTAALFTAEIGTNALPFYFYLMQILPQEYLDIFLNLH